MPGNHRGLGVIIRSALIAAIITTYPHAIKAVETSEDVIIRNENLPSLSIPTTNSHHDLLVQSNTTTTTRRLVKEDTYENFVFSKCNAGLKSAPCYRWSIWYNKQPKSQKITIPCGVCIDMDVSDGRVYKLDGLDIVGKLKFNSKSSVTIQTPFVFVQGLLEAIIPSNKVPHGRLIKFVLTKSPSNVMFYPDPKGDNEFACGKMENGSAMGCDVDQMPFVVAGGQLDIDALNSKTCPTWTKLRQMKGNRQTFDVGKLAAQCWQPGSELLFTSDSIDWNDHHVGTIKRSRSNGWIDLKQRLGKYKTSIKEDPYMAVEVALLSRNFIIEADIDPKKTKIGGHLIVMHTPGVPQKLEGVLVRRFGQMGIKGRYPIHLHMNEEVPGTNINRNVILESNQRCVVIHGTHNVTIGGNVAFDNFGHCFMTEDGTESSNTFVRNLAAMSRIMPQSKLIGGDETDDDPANFWITNPMNDIIGNVAAGSEGQGFWWELRLDFRGPSRTIIPKGTLAPIFLPGGVIKDNVAHSNKQHGMTVYLHGWHPEEQTLWENIHSYKNGLTGVFYHATRKMTLKKGFFSDNTDCIRNHFAKSIIMEDVKCVGVSDHMKALVKQGRSKTHCQLPRKEYVAGISFQPNEDERVGITLKNADFSGFDDTTCRKSAALWLEGVFVHDKLFDNYQTFENLKFSSDKNKISACDSLEQGTRNVAIEDHDGSISPTGKSGFFVKDEPAIMSYMNVKCGEVDDSCLRFCEDACLRVISFETNPSKLNEDISMIISKDGVEETIPRSSFFWTGSFLLDEQTINFFDETKDWIQAFYGVALPPGEYGVKFVNSAGGTVWPDFVREIYNQEPVCAKGKNYEYKFTYEWPDSDSLGLCDNLIKNGDFESGNPYGWQQNFANFTMISPGADNSKYALATTKRSAKGGAWNWYIGQSLDMSCLRNNGRRYFDISGKLRLQDGEGKDVGCNPEKAVEQEGSCPKLYFSRRLWEDGELIKKRYDLIGSLESRSDGSWAEFHFEMELFEDIADINQLYLLIEGAPGKEFLIDDWSMKLQPSFGESLEGTGWTQISGNGRLSPVDAMVAAAKRDTLSVLLEESPNKIIWRKCLTCRDSHVDIFYRRFTPFPKNMNMLNYLEKGWSSANNCMSKDFSLYSSYQDALDDVNRWEYCNYDNKGEGIGFPRECGPKTLGMKQWYSAGIDGGQDEVAFAIEGPDPIHKITAMTDSPTPAPEIINIAREGATASQSCNMSSKYHANRAIDGDKFSRLKKRSPNLAITCATKNPEWKVDLGESKENIVTEVRVTCRSDRAAVRDLIVSVLDADGGELKKFNVPGWCQKKVEVMPIPDGGVSARYVKLHLEDSRASLQIAEVEVMGYRKEKATDSPTLSPTAAPEIINLARQGGKASQACNMKRNKNLAANAINGIKINNLRSKKSSIAITCTTTKPTWQVDLGESTENIIQTVKVLCRGDKPSVKNLEVLLLDSLDDGEPIHKFKVDGWCQKKEEIFRIPGGGAAARYVRLQVAYRSSLQIAEVEVLGYRKGPSRRLSTVAVPTVAIPRRRVRKLKGKSTVRNCAKSISLQEGAWATQSCTLGTKDANLALDNNRNGNFFTGSVSSTCGSGKESWWMVDLGALTVNQIDNIRIFNRADGAGYRFNNINLQILNGSKKVVWSKNLVYTGLRWRFTKNSSIYADVAPVVSGKRPQGRYVRLITNRPLYIQIVEVEVNGCRIKAPPPTPALTNFALEGTAEQSCTRPPYGAQLAIDGDSKGIFNQKKTSATCCGQRGPWWMVRLAGDTDTFISNIIVHNRQEAHIQPRLSNFYVEILNIKKKAVWNFHNAGEIGKEKKFVVPYGTAGRYVRIRMTRVVCLELAEVEVMGYQIVKETRAPTPAAINLAPLGVAEQSCTLEKNFAALAIDGKTNGNMDRGSISSTCCHTGPQWWRLNFPRGSESFISSITIFNRVDKMPGSSRPYGERLVNFWLEVLDDSEKVVWSKFQDFSIGNKYTWKVDYGTVGSAVRIRLKNQMCLQLAEVQVMGHQTMTAAPTPALVNLALGKPTWQICDHLEYTSNLAVDGNTNGVLAKKSVTHTCLRVKPWWRVDLGALYKVVSVVIYNRTDKNSMFMNNVAVQVMNENTDIIEEKVFNGAVGDMITVYLDHVEGRFVQIQLTQDIPIFLHMAEVEVYGYAAEKEHEQCHA